MKQIYKGDLEYETRNLQVGRAVMGMGRGSNVGWQGFKCMWAGVIILIIISPILTHLKIGITILLTYLPEGPSDVPTSTAA